MTAEDASSPLICPTPECRPQVVPILILLFDQFDFVRTRPTLHALLLSDCSADVVVHFIIDEAMDFVFFCEARNGAHPVFVDPTYEVVCDSDVERAATPACENVEIVGH